jgi:hypothetical protein
MATLRGAMEAETWILLISSRVASAEIWRIFPVGRSVKQSGCCSGAKRAGPGEAAAPGLAPTGFSAGPSPSAGFINRSAIAWAIPTSVSWSSPCSRRL